MRSEAAHVPRAIGFLAYHSTTGPSPAFLGVSLHQVNRRSVWAERIQRRPWMCCRAGLGGPQDMQDICTQVRRAWLLWPCSFTRHTLSANGGALAAAAPTPVRERRDSSSSVPAAHLMCHECDIEGAAYPQQPHGWSLQFIPCPVRYLVVNGHGPRAVPTQG